MHKDFNSVIFSNHFIPVDLRSILEHGAQGVPRTGVWLIVVRPVIASKGYATKYYVLFTLIYLPVPIF